VVVGLLLAGLGLWFVQSDSPPTFGPIECDGDVMGPGDRCINVRGGSEVFTYESKLASQRATLASWRDDPGDEIVGWSLIGLGVLGGVVGSVMGIRRGRGPRDDLEQVPALSGAGDAWIPACFALFFGAVTYALYVGPGRELSWGLVLLLFGGFVTLSCLVAAVRQLLTG
jgi:hypothetical protein